MERAPPSKKEISEKQNSRGNVVGKLRCWRRKLNRNSDLPERSPRDFAPIAFVTIIKPGGELCNFEKKRLEFQKILRETKRGKWSKTCKLFILPKKKGNGAAAFRQNCEKSKIYKKYSKKGIA